MRNPKLHTAEYILWQVLKNRLNFVKTRALQFSEKIFGKAKAKEIVDLSLVPN
jgi:hypothetical protein